MSGRIRTIKPEMLEDAVVANLSDMAFRIFVSTFVLADDYGRLRLEPAWLQGQIFWARSVDTEVIASALAELTSPRKVDGEEHPPLVLAYVVRGQRYGEIRSWEKHQRVSHPGKPRIPAPPESLPQSSGESPETRVPDHRSPITDHRPPTTDHRPSRDAATERRFQVGTAGSDKAASVFSDAVSAATKSTYALGSAPFLIRDLCDAINAHAPPGDRSASLLWLAKTVTEWVEAVDPVHQAGWKPEKFNAWLNAKRPKRQQSRPQNAAEITKQPYDPNAPWMKVGT